MAKLHNQLSRGIWNNALKRALGLTKGEGALERVGETLTPVQDLWSQPEWVRLRGEILCAGLFDATAAAGTLAEALLLNPAGSQRVAVITQIRFQKSAAGLIDWARLNQGTLPAGFVAVNSGPVDFRDPRLIAASSTACILAQAANAAIDGGISFDRVNAQPEVVILDQAPIVLGPATGLILRQAAVGVSTLRGGFRWRERIGLPGEFDT